MLFNSFEFLVFFPLTTLLYFILPHRFRIVFLLLISCIFYMFFIPVYILILIFTILVDYFAGIFIENSTGNRRKLFLVASILANIGILAIFKYYAFIDRNIYDLARFFHLNYSPTVLRIILPIGLSFHTFQAMSYTREVYRGSCRAERNPVTFALYVMFYPQLVAGPIERPQQLLPQFYEKHYFDYERVVSGLKLMTWGLFKKVVIADRLSICVNQIYNNPYDYQGIPLIIATVCFAYQIYCDFSGYSDMAIGAARVIGFRLVNNFNRPYSSRSVSEFWKRWHISLSTWFRDYLYITMGGNRVSKPREYVNLFITFAVSGLWHGASWTFVLWGAVNGFYIIISKVTSGLRRRLVGFSGLDKFKHMHEINVISTFTLISLAWVFFRANNIREAFYIFNSIFTGSLNMLTSIFRLDMPLLLTQLKGGGYGINNYNKVIAVCSIIFLEFVQARQAHGSVENILSTKPSWFRWVVYYGIIFSIIIFGVFDNNPFIYFQF